MKIQVISDTHGKNFIPEVLANWIFIAGDIGEKDSYEENLDTYKNQNWDKVLFVKGNHDYYIKKNDIYNQNDLPMDTIDISDINEEYQLIQSTLWSNKQFGYFEQSRYNDFNYIPNWTREKYNSIHQILRNKLIEYVNSSKKEKIIILTHFPLEVIDINENEYFANKNIIDKFINPNVKSITCISGHTHISEYFSKMVNGIKITFISNQHGYKNEKTNFNNSCLFEII